MDIPLLSELVIIFSLSIAVILLCHPFKIPPIVGFLLTGVLVGPHGLKFISAVDDVDMLATIGIVLLLFTVGMEFSLSKIFEYKRYFFIGGAIQVGLTVALGFLSSMVFGSGPQSSLFFGFLLSLSSTAIVLRVLEEKSESDTPHGRFATGVMIFQDVIAIPMMLMLPLLGGGGESLDSTFLYSAVKGFSILLISLVAAHYLVPRLLYFIAKTRNRELFLLSVITICFAVAWMTSSVGLSLSLGAFLAGLIISESEFRHEAIGDILPFQDLFTSFFFISVGMLLDLSFFLSYPLIIVAIAIGVILLKTSTAALAALAVGLPLRTALLSGIALNQIGEFSFVLAKSGSQYGLSNEFHYQLFLAVAILTMGLTPTFIAWSHQLVQLIFKLPLPEHWKSGHKSSDNAVTESPYKDHIIIIGYGINGRNLAYAAKESLIPYVVLEINAETVRNEKAKGEPIYFGDATHPSILHHANLAAAKAVAIVINDFTAIRQIITQVRRINPDVYIIVRTRYLQQTAMMYELGVSEVIPDEFGSSIEVFTRVMTLFGVPVTQIEKVVDDVRSTFYEKLKSLRLHPSTLSDLTRSVSHLSVKSFQIKPSCELAGKTIAESNLRQNYNLTIIAIKREQQTLAKIEAQTVIFAQDVLTVVGERADVTKASIYFA